MRIDRDFSICSRGKEILSRQMGDVRRRCEMYIFLRVTHDTEDYMYLHPFAN